MPFMPKTSAFMSPVTPPHQQAQVLEQETERVFTILPQVSLFNQFLKRTHQVAVRGIHPNLKRKNTLRIQVEGPLKQLMRLEQLLEEAQLLI
ncbi:MAG: hypothetical protein VKJ06_06140 [Vampirovibrionales bacterium]|nr:hypothetical protein [Vampirovibrionales bacterium]